MVWPEEAPLIRGYFSRDFKKESEVSDEATQISLGRMNSAEAAKCLPCSRKQPEWLE